MTANYTPPPWSANRWCPHCSVILTVPADLDEPCPRCGGALVTPPVPTRTSDE